MVLRFLEYYIVFYIALIFNSSRVNERCTVKSEGK